MGSGRGTGIVRILRPGLSTLTTCGLAFNCVSMQLKMVSSLTLTAISRPGAGICSAPPGSGTGTLLDGSSVMTRPNSPPSELRKASHLTLVFCSNLAGSFSSHSCAWGRLLG